MADVLTTTHYTAVGTQYCWIYGCFSYKTTDYDDKVTISIYWLGEGWTEGPGTYTENASSTVAVKRGSTTLVSDTIASARTRTIAEGVYTWIQTDNKRTYSFDVAKTSSAQTVTLDLVYTIRGSSYTGSKSISIPKKTTYTITYNANGGSGAPGNGTKTYGTAYTISSTVPTRTGYIFGGWNTKADKTGTHYASGASYTTNADLKLYAEWTAKNYTISYDVNGGTAGYKPANQSKPHGAAITLSTLTTSTTPRRTGFKFMGWSTTTTGGVDYVPGGSFSVNADTVLYAVWVDSYTEPQIINYTAERCDEDGDPTDAGDYIKISFGWIAAVSAGGATNNSSIAVSGDATYSATSTAQQGTVTLPLVNIPIGSTGSATITVTDTSSDPQVEVTANVSFPKGGVPVHISGDGKAIRFFGVCSEGQDVGFIIEDIILDVDKNNTNDGMVQALTSLGWSDLL